MRNFRLLLAYDGSRYRGWQRLGNSDQTIQGKLETVLSRMLETSVEVHGSGRTDAGVHAEGQVANFHADTDMTPQEIQSYLRRYLPEDIGILDVEEAAPRFHSRLNASRKTYRYRIWNTNMSCVFDRKYVWILPDSLSIEDMKDAAKYLIGTHDFLAFCSNKHFKKSSVRTIYDISIVQVGKEIQISVTADGFLYNMVRIIVGTLVEVGRGERSARDIPAILESCVRENAGMTVPPQGLCLMEVLYT